MPRMQAGLICMIWVNMRFYREGSFSVGGTLAVGCSCTLFLSAATSSGKARPFIGRRA